MKKIKLGVRARNIVSGFTGIVTARCEYLNGCVQYCLSPPVDKDGKSVEGIYIDEGQIEIVDKGIHARKKKAPEGASSGGPQSNTPPV